MNQGKGGSGRRRLGCAFLCILRRDPVPRQRDGSRQLCGSCTAPSSSSTTLGASRVPETNSSKGCCQPQHLKRLLPQTRSHGSTTCTNLPGTLARSVSGNACVWQGIYHQRSAMVCSRNGLYQEWSVSGSNGLYQEWYVSGMVCIRDGLYQEWSVAGMVCIRNGQGAHISLWVEDAITRPQPLLQRVPIPPPHPLHNYVQHRRRLVQGLGLGVRGWGFEFKVHGSRFTVEGLGFRVEG